MGDTAGAEDEYKSFMSRYPESPLVHACVKRIARLHGGDVPKDAEAVWRSAMDTARDRQRERRRAESMCGPACLVEMLRRRQTGDGRRKTDTLTLAKEMGTSEEGTSLEAMAKAASKRGFRAAGLRLTQAGLAKQRLPLIALVSPGHYVIVEKIEPAGITVWDPDAGGPNKAGHPCYTPAAWEKAWEGVALSL